MTHPFNALIHFNQTHYLINNKQILHVHLLLRQHNFRINFTEAIYTDTIPCMFVMCQYNWTY